MRVGRWMGRIKECVNRVCNRVCIECVNRV